MLKTHCDIGVGIHIGPVWMEETSKIRVCDGHKRAYEDSKNDYSHLVFTLLSDYNKRKYG